MNIPHQKWFALGIGLLGLTLGSLTLTPLRFAEAAQVPQKKSVASAGQQGKPAQPLSPVKTATPAPAGQQPTAPKGELDEPVALTPPANNAAPVIKEVKIGVGQHGNFRYPLINNKGQVAFLGIYSVKETPPEFTQSVFLRNPDGTWDVTRISDKLINLKDDMTEINNVTMDECGNLIFMAQFAGKAGLPATSAPIDTTQWVIKSSGLVAKTKEGVKTLLRLGQEVPNMPSFFSNVANPSMNCKGTFAFIGTYSDPDGRGLFISENGVLKLVARSGQRVADVPDRVYSEHYYPSRINEQGEIAWFSRIGSDSGGIFRYRQGKIEALALQNKPAPVAYKDAEGKSQNANYLGFGNRAPAMNDKGDIVFSAFFDGPEAGRALFLKPADGPVKLLVRDGQQVPGMGTTTFKDFLSPVINNKGEVAFIAKFGGRNSGIFLATAKGIQPMVLQDEKPMDGLPGEQLNNFTPPALNDQGEIVFWGQYKDASTAIFLKDAKGLRTLAKRGEKLPPMKPVDSASTPEKR